MLDDLYRGLHQEARDLWPRKGQPMEVRQCAANLAMDARAFACTLKCISRDQDDRWPSRAETHTRLSATCSVKNWPATYRREPTAYPANSRFSMETEKFEIIATVKLFLFFSLFYFSFPSSFSFFEDKDKEMIIVFSVKILWKRRDLRSYWSFCMNYELIVSSDSCQCYIVLWKTLYYSLWHGMVSIRYIL